MKSLLYILVMLFCIGCSNKKTNIESHAYDAEQADTDTVIQKEQNVNGYNAEELKNDSFIVEYRNKIYGYSVKAVVKMLFGYDSPLLAADLHFTKKGRTFVLHSNSFGDTIFSVGRYDPEGFNIKTFKKYRKKTIQAYYKVSSNSPEELPLWVPFFFKDLDFDNIPELVIVQHGMAVRYHNGYDVYRIIEGKPILIDVPPYNQDRKDWGFGMTDYPHFHYKSKTITSDYPEGELQYEGCITYAVSNKKKDIVKVNGRKHYFNKMVKIKDEKYWED